jgi:hypothetical protein
MEAAEPPYRSIMQTRDQQVGKAPAKLLGERFWQHRLAALRLQETARGRLGVHMCAHCSKSESGGLNRLIARYCSKTLCGHIHPGFYIAIKLCISSAAANGAVLETLTCVEGVRHPSVTIERHKYVLVRQSGRRVGQRRTCART